MKLLLALLLSTYEALVTVLYVFIFTNAVMAVGDVVIEEMKR